MPEPQPAPLDPAVLLAVYPPSHRPVDDAERARDDIGEIGALVIHGDYLAAAARAEGGAARQRVRGAVRSAGGVAPRGGARRDHRRDAAVGAARAAAARGGRRSGGAPVAVSLARARAGDGRGRGAVRPALA